MVKKNAPTPINVKEIAGEENYSYAFIEKVFQKLRKANIVTSEQGNKGGYTLVKNPSHISMKDIIEAMENKTYEVFCDPMVSKKVTCPPNRRCGLKQVWKNTKTLLDGFYESISLDMLAHNNINKITELTTNINPNAVKIHACPRSRLQR